MKIFKPLILSALIITGCSVMARPYVALQFGIPKVSGSEKVIDQAVSRVALGYILNSNSRFSFLGEIGAQTGTTYDAGMLSNFDEHVNVKIGASLNGLVGVQFHTGRLNTQVLGGLQAMTFSTNITEGQDTLNKTMPLAAIRFQYLYTPNVQFSASVMHVFGKGGAVYTYHPATDTVSLNHEPSVTAFLVGVQLAL